MDQNPDIFFLNLLVLMGSFPTHTTMSITTSIPVMTTIISHTGTAMILITCTITDLIISKKLVTCTITDKIISMITCTITVMIINMITYTTYLIQQ
ncbi:MAG: hypothetical protein JXB19_11150 [Bacteroidales bacterium]|nr:hypothetical protein [Bacteroidales bacterium]